VHCLYLGHRFLPSSALSFKVVVYIISQVSWELRWIKKDLCYAKPFPFNEVYDARQFTKLNYTKEILANAKATDFSTKIEILLIQTI